MKREDTAIQALQNAITHESTINYEAIFDGFAEKGIDANNILPRQNIFTFNAWRALGRIVRRGEHGVKVVTWIRCTKKDKETGEDVGYMKPNTTTVFHISQTDALPVKTEQPETVEA
jgi:antirestriction protein ArdC